ncbi:hypothetical protein MCP_2863 [Methanocella paludicola SANAE]|uniref:Uncharacterized protein n=1 Tax=Methanocella paludicola (strain DSM 17711 / JCM 13418 / NBRC 101707 / SANAE) TaxID=304371 RepID=D1Z2L3_METPS|nr:hypothetical protein [Methanocella paludicola]BAI62935.1 hypothetical protein MCP_2863 [Methanocella paludicola SANAE]
MRSRIFAILIALLAVAASGCVLTQTAQPSPSPQATVTPVPPTVWPPATIGTITSSQVSVKDLEVSYNRNEDSMQSENFTIVMENTGRTWANNTFLTLRVTDAQTDEFYYNSPQIDLGNIPPRSTRQVNLTTDRHDFGFSVLVETEYFWGDNLEFHNKFKKAYTLAPVDLDHLSG